MTLIFITILVIVSLSMFYFYYSRVDDYSQVNRQIDSHTRVIKDFFSELPSTKLVKGDYQKKDLIFISIASYRDPELTKTIKSLLTNARNPENLRIVTYEQNDPGDISVEELVVNDVHIIRVLRDHFSKAMGPVWARYKIQQYYSDEEYYLQIDSHMRVIKDWDYILKNMINVLPEPAVLTQYPPEYSIESTDDLNTNITRSGLYIQGFGPYDRSTRIQSDLFDIQKEPERKVNYPYTSRGWSACFSFSKGSIVKDAPYDPYLPHMFFGEELDITLRLFTRGYYFFSPHKTVIFTTFERNYRTTYWEDSSYLQRKLFEACSRKRLCYKLGTDFIPEKYKNTFPIYCTIGDNLLLKNIDKYSLGKKRSIEDYKTFSDIMSFKKLRLNKTAKTFRIKTKRILKR
jgi:hypothetical protein